MFSSGIYGNLRIQFKGLCLFIYVAIKQWYIFFINVLWHTHILLGLSHIYNVPKDMSGDFALHKLFTWLEHIEGNDTILDENVSTSCEVFYRLITKAFSSRIFSHHYP